MSKKFGPHDRLLLYNLLLVFLQALAFLVLTQFELRVGLVILGILGGNMVCLDLEVLLLFFVYTGC